MGSSVGVIRRGGGVVGFVRVYEVPVPPVVHGTRYWATEAELEANWDDSDWSPHPCGSDGEPAELDAEGYEIGEWPVRVCAACRRIVDGFQPKEPDEPSPFGSSDGGGTTDGR